MHRFGPAAVAAVVLSCAGSVLAAEAGTSDKNLGIQVRRAAGELERAEITAVTDGSLAAQAGLKQGDVLLYAKGADGERNFLGGQDALERWAAAQAPDSKHELSYLRGKDLLTAQITLPATQGTSAAPAPTETASVRLLGVTVKPGADDSLEVTAIAPGSASALAGLQVGDLLFSGQTGAASADSLVSQEALDAFATKSVGTTRDVIYMRNKRFLTAKIAVPAQTTAVVSGSPLQQSPPGGGVAALGITVKQDQLALSFTPVGYITAVAPGSDADKAGLRVGDSIRAVTYADVEVNSIANQAGADALAYSTPPGTVAQFRVKRDGQDLTIPVQMTSPPASQAFVGMDVRDSSDDPYAAEVVKVQPGSPAEAAGVQAGDKIKASSFTFLGARGLHMLLTQYRGDWITINIFRDGKKISSRLTIAKDPLYATAQTLTASAPQAPAPALAALFQAAAAPAAAPSSLSAADPFAQTVTTLNGRGTQLPPFKLHAGQILEAQVSANGAPLAPKLCFEEDDMFNVDPERCYENISMSGQSVVRFRHVAVEPEIVTLSVASTDASAGSYTITTRNGNRGSEGAAALGVLETLAGKAFIVDTVDQGLPVKAAVRYLVDEPGKRGRLRYQIENGTTADFTYALDNNGQLTWASPTNNGVVYLGIDGLLYQQAGDTVGVRGLSGNGEFLNVTERRLLRGDNAAQMHVGVFGRSQKLSAASPATDEQVTTMLLDGPMHIAQAQQQRVEDWGPFAQMAGNFYVFLVNNTERIVSYQWETPGEALSIKYWNSDALGTKPDPQQRMVYNPTTRTVINTITYTNNSTTTTTLKRQADGSMREDGYSDGTWYTSVKGNEVTYRMDPVPGKAQSPTQTRRVLDANMLKVFAERTQATQARLAQERAQAAAQQEEESSIGIFDVLNFANTVQSAMSSPEGYMAAVTQAAPELAPILNGVAAAQSGGTPLASLGGLGGNNVLAAIPGGVNPLTGMGGGANPLTGLGGGPTGVRGSYPTRPNLAEGSQCPGFTMGNYRTHAFNGGRDQQLFALCGQAFEYYKMYLNAIDQGYSEADSNRTYNAHEGAVRNLQSMLR